MREVENPPHVSKERSHELVDATHGPLDMAECYVKGSQVKLKFATRTFRAQVISCLFVFCLEVSKTKKKNWEMPFKYQKKQYFEKYKRKGH